jgi:tetratricopeptide (TPR) repeat protein
MRAVTVCVLAALLTTTAPARAEAPKRVALVIGNAAYRSLESLGNPRLDASRLAALLDANGFDVVRCDGQHPGCVDLDRDGLEDALETFRKGEVLHDQGHIPEALASYSAAQDIAERRFKGDPRSSGWAGDLARAYGGLAEVRFATGDRAGALSLWRKALTVVEASAATVEEDEIKSAGKPGAKTASALTSVEWGALLARDTSKAIAVSERARALVPELDAAHHINRAHASSSAIASRRPEPSTLQTRASSSTAAQGS